jgi:hypothetical protein
LATRVLPWLRRGLVVSPVQLSRLRGSCEARCGQSVLNLLRVALCNRFTMLAPNELVPARAALFNRITRCWNIVMIPGEAL